MDKIVEHWIERSQYDLDTAKVMLDAGRNTSELLEKLS